MVDKSYECRVSFKIEELIGGEKKVYADSGYVEKGKKPEGSIRIGGHGRSVTLKYEGKEITVNRNSIMSFLEEVSKKEGFQSVGFKKHGKYLGKLHIVSKKDIQEAFDIYTEILKNTRPADLTPYKAPTESRQPYSTLQKQIQTSMGPSYRQDQLEKIAAKQQKLSPQTASSANAKPLGISQDSVKPSSTPTTEKSQVSKKHEHSGRSDFEKQKITKKNDPSALIMKKIADIGITAGMAKEFASLLTEEERRLTPEELMNLEITPEDLSFVDEEEAAEKHKTGGHQQDSVEKPHLEHKPEDRKPHE